MSICHCSSSYSKAAINLGLCGVMAHISVQLGSNHPIHNIFILFKGNVNSPQRGFQKNLISVYQLQQYFNNIVETLRCIHFSKHVPISAETQVSILTFKSEEVSRNSWLFTVLKIVH